MANIDIYENNNIMSHTAEEGGDIIIFLMNMIIITELNDK